MMISRYRPRIYTITYNKTSPSEKKGNDSRSSPSYHLTSCAALLHHYTPHNHHTFSPSYTVTSDYIPYHNIIHHYLSALSVMIMTPPSYDTRLHPAAPYAHPQIYYNIRNSLKP